MKRISFLSLAAVALISCGGAQGSGESKFSITHSEFRTVLPNGLKVVIMPDKTTPMVQVDTRYDVGANEDPPGKSGLAHYVEHMMFQWRLFGPEGPALFTVLPTITTGMNAYTAPDRTHYWLQAPKEDVAKLLDVEAQRMRSAGSKCNEIPDAEFPRELDVVRNEIRRSLGTAQGLILPIVLKHVFPENHPYHHTAGGQDANLVTLTKKDVCTFMSSYYYPSRATLLISGNVDPEKIGKLVAYYFGRIPRGNPKPLVEVPAVKTEKARYDIKLDLEKPIIVVAWALPPKTDPDSVKGMLAAGSLGGRISQFNDQYKFAEAVQVIPMGEGKLNASGGPRSPIVLLFAQLKKEDDVDTALDFIWKAASGAHRGLDSVAEFLTGEEQIARERARYVMSLEPLSARNEEVANLIEFGKGTAFNGDTDYLIDQLRRMDEVDTADFDSFVENNLARSRAEVFVFHPDANAASGDERAAGKLTGSPEVYEHRGNVLDPNLANQPATYPKEPGILATTETYQLSNGMTVKLLPYDGMPVVSVALQFKVGSANEDPDKAGLAEMAGQFLNTPPDATVYNKLGLQSYGNVDADTTTFGLRGISIYLPQIIEGTERWITAGVYSQEQIEDWQDQFRTMMKHKEQRASEAFSRAWTAAVYGENHPYTTNGDPTLATYQKFGRDMLTDFKKKHYSAANATLIVAGKFNPAEAKKIIKDNFGGWSKGHEDVIVTTPAVTAQGARYIGVVGEDEQNANLTVMFTGPAGFDLANYGKRRLAAGMINEAVGRVRTTLGSTYGVYGGWVPSNGPSVYRMGGLVESARAGESLKFMRDQINALRTGEGFNLDFVKARMTAMKQLLGQTTESYSLAGTLATGARFGLPNDYRWQEIKEVATAKPEEVRALINEEIPQDSEIIVVMADKDTIEKTFEAIGVTDYKLIDPNAEKATK